MAKTLISYAIATPNVLTQIPAQGTADLLVSAISEALQQSGWLPAATLPTGFRLLAVSPQGYSVNLDLTSVKILGSSVPNAVQWQLKSAVGTGAVGSIAYSQWDITFSYQIVAFPCGWFFSRPGTGNGEQATCGGIPYSPYGALIGAPPSPPDECNLGTSVPSEIWWMMAQNGINGQSTINPRASLGLNYGSAAVGSKQFIQNCGCQSGNVVIGNGGPGDPQVVQLSSTWDEGFNFPLGVSEPLWYSGADFLYPAFIAWGDLDTKPAKIRGQLFNAANRTGEYPADRVQSWDGYTWMNYTDEFFFGSLWSFLGAGGTGNWSW